MHHVFVDWKPTTHWKTTLNGSMWSKLAAKEGMHQLANDQELLYFIVKAANFRKTYVLQVFNLIKSGDLEKIRIPSIFHGCQ